MISPGPVFAFSTLACPEWSVDRTIEAAGRLGYDAIEWRGGPDGHVRTSWPARRRAALRRRSETAGVAALAVTAYATFTSSDPRLRSRSALDLLRHVELAADLGAPFVRTFVGHRERSEPIGDVAARAAEAIRPVAAAAAAAGVALALEPHDDFATLARLRLVLDALDHPGARVALDVVNAWEAGEAPRSAARRAAGRVAYVQLKDARRGGSGTCLTEIGRGEVPLVDALVELTRSGPLPPLSFEWERAWHPELAPADVVLGPALEELRRLAARALDTVRQPSGDQR